MKKNCKNCKYLEYYDADYEEFCDSGFYCDKRDDENVGWNMKSDSYLEKSKVCFEPKQVEI